MANSKFELETVVGAEPNTAFDFLFDLENHKKLHTFLSKVEVRGTGLSDSGQIFTDYWVTEEIPFAMFKYRIRFETRLIKTAPFEYSSRVKAQMGTLLHNVVRIEKVETETRIHETVTITAPSLTIKYFTKQAFRAHSRTFELLPSRLVE